MDLPSPFSAFKLFNRQQWFDYYYLLPICIFCRVHIYAPGHTHTRRDQEYALMYNWNSVPTLIYGRFTLFLFCWPRKGRMLYIPLIRDPEWISWTAEILVKLAFIGIFHAVYIIFNNLCNVCTAMVLNEIYEFTSIHKSGFFLMLLYVFLPVFSFFSSLHARQYSSALLANQNPLFVRAYRKSSFYEYWNDYYV